MISERGDAEGDRGTGSSIRRRGARIAAALAERGSSTLGLLLIAFWAALAPRRVFRPARQGMDPAVPLAWEPRSLAWREPGLTLQGGGLHRS